MRVVENGLIWDVGGDAIIEVAKLQMTRARERDPEHDIVVQNGKRRLAGRRVLRREGEIVEDSDEEMMEEGTSDSRHFAPPPSRGVRRDGNRRNRPYCR